MFGILTLLAMCCFLPVIWMLLSGFKDTAEMYSIPPTFLPKSLDMNKIAEIWKIIHFERYFFNTLYIIAGCWAFDVTLNGLAGYVLSKVRPIGSSLLETLIFWTMLLPGISMVPLYMTFVDVPLIHVNLIGTFIPMWLMAGCSAFNIFLFRNFFNGIPKDYFEAARIDGCSNLGIFFRIVLPMSKPLIAVVSIGSITGSWSVFMWPYLILGNTSLEPVSVMLYQMSRAASAQLQDNQIMLLMMLSVVPPLTVYALFSKHIMGGFNMSGIKG
jgi:multiple sugar transport system permease protein